jgi:hypothetical protein
MKKQGRAFRCAPCREIIMFFAVSDASPYIALAAVDRVAKRAMRDPFIREKFTRERSAARKFTKEYFERFPKDQYQTELEGWRLLQSANIEFTMKRLREPIGAGG